MRDYAKTGGKVGKPAYRTPSSFLAKKFFEKIRHRGRRIQKFLFHNEKWEKKRLMDGPLLIRRKKDKINTEGRTP